MKKIVLFTVFTIISLTGSIIAQPIKKELKLEDIWLNGSFMGARFDTPESMNDGIHFSKLDHPDSYGELNKYEYKTGNLIETLVKGKDLLSPTTSAPITIENYKFSSDESKLLILTGVERIYRHSSKGHYYVYDFKTKKLTNLSDKGKQSYAEFSPDGSKIAFVRDNNLFYVDVASNKEIAITTDGKYNTIINGAADWVYEEEFAMSKAYEWSPNSKQIAFIRFDESAVKEFSMTKFERNLYPKPYEFKYPKAGEANSVVAVHIYELGKNESKPIDIGVETDIYLPRIKWANADNSLVITRLNRLQNKLELLIVNTSDQITVKTLYEETSTTFISLINEVVFLKDNKHFIIPSEKDGFRHFYLYDMSGKLINQITKGNWDAIAYKGVNEATRTLYYTSAESSPSERDVFSIRLDGSGKKKLSVNKGTNNTTFSKNFSYFINTYSNANTPSLVTLHTGDGKQVRILEENKKLKDQLLAYNLSKKEFSTFKTTAGITLNYWIIRPANFDSTKKHPVFMTVYGGPGSNTVTNSWGGSDYLWHQLLAQKGYIVISVDNRGTGSRGREFKNCIYRQMGKLECEDQIEAARYFGSLNYVDKTRIGIQGWSYGGFVSSLCITKGADHFKAAIAVSPVTNWRYYDNVYTERYLDLPQNNAAGYDDNSPINHVKALKGNYLLVHGTADDNVHFQNSVEMVTALIKNNKQFQSFYYPDKNHSIIGGNTRLHLYTLMTNFLLNNL